MTRIIGIASLALASAIVLSAASSAMARGAGHVAGPQHNNGAVSSSGGGTAVAAKSVNLGGLGKFVLSNAIKGGKLVGGSLGSLGGAMAGPGKCPGGSCRPQL
ncbi:MAG: hypothetical protein ACTHLO_18650 [Pseudolabrys sp.]